MVRSRSAFPRRRAMQTGDRAALHTRKVTSGIDASDDALVAAYAQVRDEESKTNW